MRPKNDERKVEVYNFVTSFMKECGVCPTTQEIGNKLGMAKSTVSKYMNRLVEEGLVENTEDIRPEHKQPYRAPGCRLLVRLHAVHLHLLLKK